ncbi:MAG TPA: S8 family peptidase [Verrucomicrobiae bacterium]|nr:S8 family peptidase [Verrucomicrobiae bacterium]
MLREQNGLPVVPADKGFVLKLPEGVDVDPIVRALGVELVAETEEGLMLVSSEDLEFTKLEDVLRQFETGVGNLVAGSSLLDIYDQPDDTRRLKNVLAPDILALWPLDNAFIYTFDLGIQTATSTRDVKWPTIRKRKDEKADEFLQRREEARRYAWEQANIEWDENAETRVNELNRFVEHYGGEIVSGLVSDPAHKAEAGMVFPDSVQVRVQMSGEGFRDVILNFAHLFEVSLPPELQQQVTESSMRQVEEQLLVRPPPENAPRVCVIDSGIEEGHRWLEPAIDSATSRCFLPNVTPDDVADYVRPQGHGTRVAGAVLYPNQVPVAGEVESVAWIQNARVLDSENRLPDTLAAEEYLQQVVAHFHRAPHFTKIFNHSINANIPCPKHRMTSWAAKMDQLSHEQEVLFIQSAGNQTRLDNGDESNPGLRAHLDAGKQPPDHQLEASMRVANPAQSIHALTVGSVSATVFEDANRRSFAAGEHQPSGFSRSGYGEPWSVVKPDVVDVGGDLVYSTRPPRIVGYHEEVSVELLNSTMHGAPAHSKDGAGTSFAAPKVAHTAAHLQNLFPAASPLLYRALIVQSARWPEWAENTPDKDKVLRLIGYGLPSLERASMNCETRVTLITPDSEILPSKQLHLYTVRIPEELLNAAVDARIRIDVTLAYTALPRRTRARRTGYLETWLDWEASKRGEPRHVFLERMTNGGDSLSAEFPWTLHKRDNLGAVQETSRNHGSVQKDWALIDSYDLPREFAIAVRSHKGWNHLDGAGSARYCLVVSFEVMKGEVPIYSLIENEIRVGEPEIRVET